MDVTCVRGERMLWRIVRMCVDGVSSCKDSCIAGISPPHFVFFSCYMVFPLVCSEYLWMDEFVKAHSSTRLLLLVETVALREGVSSGQMLLQSCCALRIEMCLGRSWGWGECMSG